MRTVYLVPTRGRPQNAVRLAQAFKDTGTAHETRLVFFLDDDDPELAAYREAFNGRDDLSFGLVIGPRLRLGGTLNRYAPVYAQRNDAIGFMGDDHVPRTPGWDQILTSHVAVDPLAVVYGNDLVHGPSLPTAVLLGAPVVRALGFMVPPGLIHLYMDNFWKELGLELGTLRYRHDAVIEHLHPITGKVEWDDRYREVNDGAVYAADEATYDAFKADGGFAAAVQRVRGQA